MYSPILTIVIPTYNRSTNLLTLLNALSEETASVENDVVVYVSDNCSPDDTAIIIANTKKEWPRLLSYRHQANIGADLNFLHCVENVNTRWFWILGDDDLPKRGVVSKIVRLLRERHPALIYMNSEWVSSVTNAHQGQAVDEFRIADLDALSFASHVSTWFTYISGLIIDKEALSNSLHEHYIDRFNGSSLIQLGWILPLLHTNGPFLYVYNKCILATSGNTGGYQVLRTFFINFPNIITDSFPASPNIWKSIMDYHVNEFLPSLAWQVRFKNIGNFHKESSIDIINKGLGSYPQYWIFIWPILTLPKYIATTSYVLFIFISKLKAILINNKRN